MKKDQKSKGQMNSVWALALVVGFVAAAVTFSDTNGSGFLAAQRGGAIAPGEPTSLSASAGDTEVDLSWTAPASNGGAAITDYIVKIAPSGEAFYTENVRSAATSYTVTGLTNDISYRFSVAAINSAGTGNYSVSAQATPVAAVSYPSAPTLTDPVVGDSQLELSWTAPVDEGSSAVTGYQLSVTPLGGSESQIDLSDVTTYTLTELTNDLSYRIKVRAENTQGYGDWSSNVTATPEATVSGPSAPSISNARAGDSEILVTWTAPGDNGGSSITGYTIEVTPDGGSASEIDAGNVTTYTLSSLTNGTEYSIRVRASNADADGTYSSASTATPSTTPDAPTNIIIVAGDGALAVSWTAPADNGGSAITDYTISYTPAGGSEQTVDVGSAATSYAIEGLTNGLDYTIKILAVNGNGDGSYSGEATKAPDESGDLSLVGDPTVTVTNTTAVVTWITAKAGTSRVSFGPLNASQATSEYNTRSRVVNHSVTVSDLLPCTTYRYTVYSRDASSQEITSSNKEFTTTGCLASSEVRDVEINSVNTISGGELDFTSSDIKTKLRVPANLKDGYSSVVFQVKQLEKNTVVNEIGNPESAVEWLGDHVYNLSAYDNLNEVNDFDNPVTVTIQYNREDVTGIDLSTLKIHHYEESTGWSVLSNCSNTYDPNTGIGEISCDTSSFSIFGLFGEDASGSAVASSGSYTTSYSSSNSDDEESDSDDVVSTEAETETQDSLVSEEPTNDDSDTENMVKASFTKDLWQGMTDVEVLALQRFLNQHGFALSEDGPGSPGMETGYFGSKTYDALRKFQTKYAENILQPAGLTSPTGYFGVFTRNFIKNNF